MIEWGFTKTGRELRLLEALGAALERERDLGERIRQLEDQVSTLEAQRDGFPDPIPSIAEDSIELGEWRDLDVTYGNRSLVKLAVRVHSIDLVNGMYRVRGARAIIEFGVRPSDEPRGNAGFQVLLDVL